MSDYKIVRIMNKYNIMLFNKILPLEGKEDFATELEAQEALAKHLWIRALEYDDIPVTLPDGTSPKFVTFSKDNEFAAAYNRLKCAIATGIKNLWAYQHIRTEHDTNGNPRMLYLIFARDGQIVKVFEQGYGNLPSIYRNALVELHEIDVQPAEYNRLVKWGKQRNIHAWLG